MICPICKIRKLTDMKKIFLFEPSIASNNIGDQIIVESIKKELSKILYGNFCIELPTHTPISNRYMYFLGKPDMKFICGSNIIVENLNSIIHLKQWMLNPLTMCHINNSIFIGVGIQRYNPQMGFFTKHAYRKFFNKNFLHSVRDCYTERILKSIGIKNVINTGCPTMWSLTEDHCKNISKKKSVRVIFTLTDYSINPKRDNYLLFILKNKYQEVYFWPQGYNDYSYFKTLNNIKDIQVVEPCLASYDALLERGNIDYIGTRLHGGIRALQKGIRTLIIGIDNRALELHNDFNLPVLKQDNIEQLPFMIDNTIEVNIHLPTQNISNFLIQFKCL